jgi:hypothetical protein
VEKKDGKFAIIRSERENKTKHEYRKYWPSIVRLYPVKRICIVNCANMRQMDMIVLAFLDTH